MPETIDPTPSRTSKPQAVCDALEATTPRRTKAIDGVQQAPDVDFYASSIPDVRGLDVSVDRIRDRRPRRTIFTTNDVSGDEGRLAHARRTTSATSTTAGCFRCHDDNHATADGEVLTKDCNICHTVLEQKEAGVLMIETPENVFTHPVDMGDLEDYNCLDCHNGGPM
jgi:hypothetical protein